MTEYKRTIYGTTLIAALVIAAVYFFAPAQHQPDFAPGNDVKVFLPVAGSNQKMRYERYYPDRQTRSLTDIEYLDGTSEQVFYSADNVRVSAVKYFPPDETGARQVKSRATYDADRGRHFTSHQVYRQDGSLERSGLLLSDGNYQSRYYFADGKAIARDRLFNRDRAFISETQFAQDGTIVALTVQSQSDQKDIVRFWPNGSRKASYSLNIAGGANGYFYAEDGTVISEFSKTYWNINEVYYNAAGKVWQRRLSYSNNLSIRLFNDDGKLIAQQVWRMRPASGDKAAYKMLASVTLFKPDALRPYRTINMDRTGQYVESINNVDGRSMTKTLDANGVVIKVEGNDGNGFYSGAPRTAEEAFENVDPALLSEPFFNVLPELVDKDSPRLEYDYD